MTRRLAALAVVALLAADAFGDPAATTAATDGIDAASRGPSFEERVDVIRRRVQSAASYPALAQLRRIEGTSVVGFEITADGRPREIEVAETSGFPQLDRAAERAVENAGQLPWVFGRLEIPVRFELAARSGP